MDDQWVKGVETVIESEDWQKQDSPGTEFRVSTFGCSCCSSTTDVSREDGIKALDYVIQRLEKELAGYKAMRLKYPL